MASNGLVSSYAGSTTVTTTTTTTTKTMSPVATMLSGKTVEAARAVTSNVIHPSTNGTSTTTPSKHPSSSASSEKNATPNNNSSNHTSDANSNGNIPATTSSGKTSAFSLVSPTKVTNVAASPAATGNGLKRSDTPSSGSLLSSERLDEDEIGSPSAKRTVTASPSAPPNWNAIEEHLYQKLRESDLSILLNHIKGLERSAIDLLRREDEETMKAAELRILDISESSPVTTPRKMKPTPASTPITSTTTTTTNPTSNTTQQHHTSTTSHPCESSPTATTATTTVAATTTTTTTTTSSTKLGSPIPTPAEATVHSSTNSCLTGSPSSFIS